MGASQTLFILSTEPQTVHGSPAKEQLTPMCTVYGYDLNKHRKEVLSDNNDDFDVVTYPDPIDLPRGPSDGQ